MLRESVTNLTIGTTVTAPTTTTLQANFKLPNGDLLNVYGNDVLGFKQGLEDLGSLAELVSVTGNALRGVQVVVDAGLTAAPAAHDATAPWDRPQAPASTFAVPQPHTPQANGGYAPPAPSFAVAQPQYVQAPQQQAAPAGPPAPQCRHGAMTFRESKPGAPKAWKAWMCAAPKGTPDACEPQWLR